MTTVTNAIEIIKNASEKSSTVILPLQNCLHFVSAEDLYAPINVPLFDNSAMDGYAFRFEDFQNNLDLKVIGEIQAGVAVLNPLKDGEAIRIFTGAPIPRNADTVIPQEDVLLDNGFLKFKNEIAVGANIRKKGTQTPEGTMVLKKNTKITAEYIGFLATFGISKLLVYPKVKVGIITTGKELVKIGNPLQNNQIYESNSVFLEAALQELGITPIFTIWADDDKETLKKIVTEKSQQVELLIFTGGISVGDYDFVKPILEELGVNESFYKIKQKPGKPLFFGKLNGTDVFALPGNPSAVVMCFHVYIKPFLQAKIGMEVFMKKKYGILLTEYTKKAGLTHFLKAYVEHNKVEILSNQLSYQMDAYAKANAFAVLREEQEYFQVGEKVEFINF